MNRYQQKPIRTWLKFSILTVIVLGLSIGLYYQEGEFEFRNVLLWLFYAAIGSFILLHGLRRRVELHDYHMIFQNLFRLHHWDYQDIVKVGRGHNGGSSNAGDSSSKSYYFELTNKQGKRIRIPWSIFNEDHERFDFLNELKQKNPSVQFDYVCQIMLGERNPEADVKSLFKTVWKSYQDSKREGE